MPELTIDATEAKSFEPIPDGTYETKILEISEVKQGPKARYVNITFEITDGDYIDRRLWRNFVVEGPGSAFLVDLANKALPDEEFEVGSEFSLDTDDLIGQAVIVVTVQEEYEGNTKSEVKRILAV